MFSLVCQKERICLAHCRSSNVLVRWEGWKFHVLLLAVCLLPSNSCWEAPRPLARHWTMIDGHWLGRAGNSGELKPGEQTCSQLPALPFPVQTSATPLTNCCWTQLPWATAPRRASRAPCKHRFAFPSSALLLFLFQPSSLTVFLVAIWLRKWSIWGWADLCEKPSVFQNTGQGGIASGEWYLKGRAIIPQLKQVKITPEQVSPMKKRPVWENKQDEWIGLKECSDAFMSP